MKFIKGMLRSFGYALNGLKTAVLQERNFRIDLVAAVFVVLFGIVYGLNNTETAILILTAAAVPVAELFNTAIEETNDRIGYEEDIHTKKAKDLSAASVLVFSVAAVGIAICLFSDLTRLAAVLVKLFTTYYIFIVLGLIIVSIFFIVLPKSKIKDNSEKKRIERK